MLENSTSCMDGGVYLVGWVRRDEPLQILLQLAYPFADYTVRRFDLSIRVQATAQPVRAEIDRNHFIGTHRAGQRNRHRIDKPAVHQDDAITQHRRKKGRQRDGRAHRIDSGAVAQPHLSASLQRRSDCREGHGQLFDGTIHEVAPKELHHSIALEQPTGQAYIHEPDHVLYSHPEHPLFESIQLASRVRGAYQRPDRGSANQIRVYPGLLERADYSHVRPAARRSAT